MFKQRLLTVLVLLPLILGALFFLPDAPLAMTVVVVGGLCVLVGTWEWARMVKPGDKKFLAAMLCLMVGVTGLMVLGLVYLSQPLLAAGMWCLPVLFWWLCALILIVLWEKGRLPEIWPTAAKMLPAFFVLPFFFIACLYLASFVALMQGGRTILIALLLVVWVTDIGAYFSGKMWGKHKLAAKTSPGKTWQGVIGGVVLSVLLTLLFALLVTQGYFASNSLLFIPNLSWHTWFNITGIVALLSFASVIGDLFESLIKRVCGVKDSGGIFPGHGGMLDRIDSLTAAAPIAVTIALLSLPYAY